MIKTTFEPPDPDDRGQFDPEPWRAVGLTTEDGLRWWEHRVDPASALRWQRAGVSEPIDAVRWKIAGVSPGTVREWIYAKIDAREAVAWNELGFSVADARKHKRAGRTPVEAYGRTQRLYMAGTAAPRRPGTQRLTLAPGRPVGPWAGSGPDPRGFLDAVGQQGPLVVHSYVQRQWIDDEAIAWAKHGIDASDALAWKELGLTPVEAERHQQQGMSAMQTAKAWWRAGIPVDEVADWIGAGLTPEEAAEQRANGVTVDRAAVLRSLRRDQ